MLRFLKSALGPGLVAAAVLLTTPAGAEEHPTPAAAAVHEAEPDPMEVQPGLAIWTVVVFAGLFALLTKFAWTPLSEALHAREEHLKTTLLQTERARDDAAALLAEHRKLMAEVDDKARDLLYQAHRKGETAAAELLRKAQGEAEAARDRAQREIASARDQALAEIWTKTADAAVSVAAKVLARDLGDDERRRLFDDAVRSLPEAGGART